MGQYFVSFVYELHNRSLSLLYATGERHTHPLADQSAVILNRLTDRFIVFRRVSAATWRLARLKSTKKLCAVM